MRRDFTFVSTLSRSLEEYADERTGHPLKVNRREYPSPRRFLSLTRRSHRRFL